MIMITTGEVHRGGSRPERLPPAAVPGPGGYYSIVYYDIYYYNMLYDIAR